MRAEIADLKRKLAASQSWLAAILAALGAAKDQLVKGAGTALWLVGGAVALWAMLRIQPRRS